MEQKYFAVTAKCGHVRKGKYIEVTFAIVAESGKEAAKIGRTMPRVKHDHPMAILNVVELSEDDYNELYNENRNNPYLQCKNKQEQKEGKSKNNNIYRKMETRKRTKSF